MRSVSENGRERIENYFITREELCEAKERHLAALAELQEACAQHDFPHNVLVTRKGKLFQLNIENGEFTGSIELPNSFFMNLD